MSDAREAILYRVRRGLAAHAGDDLRRARVQNWISAHERGTTPSRALGDEAALKALFQKMAEESGASCQTIGKAAEFMSQTFYRRKIRCHHAVTIAQTFGRYQMRRWQYKPTPKVVIVCVTA